MLHFCAVLFKKSVSFIITGVMLSFSALAAPLEWSIINPVQSANPGDKVVFSGIIINNTGFTLESTDLFLDFIAFDPSYLVPNQELGLLPFTLPDSMDSGNVTLFNVDIDSSVLPDTYHLLVMLQDISGNLTDAIDVSLIISEVPEPSAAILLLLGLAALLFVFTYQCHKRRSCDIS